MCRPYLIGDQDVAGKQVVVGKAVVWVQPSGHLLHLLDAVLQPLEVYGAVAPGFLFVTLELQLSSLLQPAHSLIVQILNACSTLLRGSLNI